MASIDENNHKAQTLWAWTLLSAYQGFDKIYRCYKHSTLYTYNAYIIYLLKGLVTVRIRNIREINADICSEKSIGLRTRVLSIFLFQFTLIIVYENFPGPSYYYSCTPKP